MGTTASMSGIERIHLSAVALGRHRLPGPALAGRAPPGVVVCVTNGGGDPVDALPPAAFTVQEVLAAESGGPSARAVAVDAFVEIVPGVYTFITRESALSQASETHALLVTVKPHGAGPIARALVRVDGL
jgi:hypothetical protein